MKRTQTKQVLFLLAASVVGAVLGLLAGFLLGRFVALRQAEGRLNLFAARIVQEGDVASAEARAMLAAMRASPYPFCSDEEMSYFRTRIFAAEEVKDAGRIRGGEIICSTTLGRLKQPFKLPRPNFSQPDGTKVYWNLPPFQTSQQGVVSLELGDSYVIFGAHDQQPAEPFAARYTIAVVGTSAQPFACANGAWSQTADSTRSRNGQGRRGDSLYATRCSSRYFNCISATMTIPAILQAERGHLVASSFLGGLAGASLGLAGALLYWRNQSLEQQLRRAIRGNQLRTVYQPIVNLASGRIVGAEALLRWTDEEGGMVSPDLFVKVAEECGFVEELTALVTRRSLRDFGATLLARPGFRLSLNVTAADLTDPRLLSMLERVLEDAGVSPRSVSIEITESSTARHEAAIESIRSLRQRGHSVHVDDFGTGYSSLAYLHELSVDAIKIDKAFTRSIGTEAVTQAILPQILAMAEVLNLEVIVEGIETSLQASYFTVFGERILAQGWLFGRPVAAAAFHRLLAENEQYPFIPSETA
jgi:sensor c-di-GMP phosphodiesterase-like protein